MRNERKGAVMGALATLGPTALDNIAETIETKVRDSEGKVAIGTKAKVHQDNVSFDLLGRLGFGRTQQKEEAGVLKLSPETEKRLVDGIDRAQKAEIEFKNAEEEGNTNMMIQWGEALRKTTMNCQDIAKTVLGVEELVKGKTVIRA